MEKNVRIKPNIVYFILFLLFSFGVYLNLEREPSPKSPADIEVTFLNVGQGDSALVKTSSGKYIIIDSGPDKSILSELGAEIPIGKKEIEAIIISHPHADHIGGIIYLFNFYQVKRIYMAKTEFVSSDLQALHKEIIKNNVAVIEILPEKEVWIDNVQLKFLKILSEHEKVLDVNDESIVLHVKNGECDYLFLGDLSSGYQERIRLPENDKIEVLKVSHHGARDALSEKANEHFKAGFAIISAGRGNQYGHPHQSSVISHSRYSTVLRTDILGRIKTQCRDGHVNIDN